MSNKQIVFFVKQNLVTDFPRTEVIMFLLQAAAKTNKVQSVSGKVVKNFKQIFLTPELTEEERWDMYYDYSAVTKK